MPCGPIYTIDQVYADPQVKHLGMAQPVEDEGQESVRMVGQPMSLSRTPSKLVARPPALGEHTDAVLKEFGFSAKEIAALRKAAQCDLTQQYGADRTSVRGGRTMDDVTKTETRPTRCSRARRAASAT